MLSTWKPPAHAEGAFPQNCPRNQVSEMHFDKFPHPSTFSVLEDKLQKLEECSCSNFLMEAMLWIRKKWRWPNQWTILKLRDRVEGIEDSIILRCLMRRSRLHWGRSSRTPTSRGDVSLEEQKGINGRPISPREEIACMIYEYFRWLEHMKLFLIIQIYSVSLHMATISSILIPDGTRLCSQQMKFPMTGFWKARRRCEYVQTVLAMYEQAK